jgi:hypothetical protein
VIISEYYNSVYYPRICLQRLSKTYAGYALMWQRWQRIEWYYRKAGMIDFDCYLKYVITGHSLTASNPLFH